MGLIDQMFGIAAQKGYETVFGFFYGFNMEEVIQKVHTLVFLEINTERQTKCRMALVLQKTTSHQ